MLCLLVECYLQARENTCLSVFSALQVNDVAFSFDESHFATCSEDGSVRVWSTLSYELVVQFQVLNQVSEYTQRGFCHKHCVGYFLHQLIFTHQSKNVMNTDIDANLSNITELLKLKINKQLMHLFHVFIRLVTVCAGALFPVQTARTWLGDTVTGL